MLSLYGFVLCVSNASLQSLANNKSKTKKKNAGLENELKLLVIHEKERVQLLSELIRHLKLKFQCIDASLSKFMASLNNLFGS